MRKMKRWAALLCAVLMTVTLWPMQVWAAETEDGNSAGEETITRETSSYSYTFINPLLPPSGDDIALFSNGTDYAVLTSDVGFPSFNTIQEAADYARSEFKKHDYLAAFMEIPVDFETIPQEQWDTVCKEIGSQIFEEMIRHDPQDPTGGDYLLYHCYGIRCFASTPKEGICRVVLQTGDFLSSMAQEDEAAKAANEIIQSLHLDGMSDHEKLRAIYDWLCKNVKYDNSTPGSETEMLLQHSAYAALVKHTAVCQGYATAFYRLALMAGLNARVVTGTGAGEPHGWNIVQLDGKWYYVDATWDAGVAEENWRFFLRAQLDWHELDEYGKAVVAQYALSPIDFSVKIGDLNGSEGVDVTDVAMLYTYLVTGSTGESALTKDAFLCVADVNGDDAIDVYDLQLLYETVCSRR